MLRTSFATHGLPDIIVSDNAKCFVGAEFQDFLKKNGILHLPSPPRHPASNGLVEKAVQTVKRGLEKQHIGFFHTKLQRILFSYRTTPQSTTGKSPAEMLMKRTLKTHVDLLHPNRRSETCLKQLRRSTRERRQPDRLTY